MTKPLCVHETFLPLLEASLMIPQVVVDAIFYPKIVFYVLYNQTKLNDGFNPDTIIKTH